MNTYTMASIRKSVALAVRQKPAPKAAVRRTAPPPRPAPRPQPDAVIRLLSRDPDAAAIALESAAERAAVLGIVVRVLWPGGRILAAVPPYDTPIIAKPCKSTGCDLGVIEKPRGIERGMIAGSCPSPYDPSKYR